MGSLNKIMLIGNVGKDPELKYSKTGDPFATFSLATSQGYTPKGGTDRQETTEWHRIIVWRQLAEQAEKFVKKGRKLYIEGRVQTRSYQDANNQTQKIYEIVATQMEFLDSPKDFPANGGTEPIGSGTTLASRTPSRYKDENLDLDDLPDAF